MKMYFLIFKTAGRDSNMLCTYFLIICSFVKINLYRFFEQQHLTFLSIYSFLVMNYMQQKSSTNVSLLTNQSPRKRNFYFDHLFSVKCTIQCSVNVLGTGNPDQYQAQYPGLLMWSCALWLMHWSAQHPTLTPDMFQKIQNNFIIRLTSPKFPHCAIEKVEVN